MKIILLLSIALSQSVFAQDFLTLIVPSKETTRLELNGHLSSKSDEKPEGETAVFERSVGAESRLYGKGKNHLSVGSRWRTLDFTKNLDGLKDYHSFSVNFTYKRDMEDGKFWSFIGSWGTASDRPFKDSRDTTLGGTYLQRLSHKWIFLVNYSNNRAFLNNVPLPGFAYLHTMSRERTLMFGFPFLVWTEQLNEHFKLRVVTLLPFMYQVRFFHRTWSFAETYIGAERTVISFFDTRREKDEDRVFWTETKLTLGLEGVLTKQIKFDLQGGFSFDRELTQSESFGDSDKNSLEKVGSAPFVSLGLKMAF